MAAARECVQAKPCMAREWAAQVHLLLTSYPLVKMDRVYRYVFERILGERVSTAPVTEVGNGA